MNKKELVDIFVTQNEFKKYILGRTPFGQLAKSRLKEKGVEIEAYIDQFSSEVEFDELPVIHSLVNIPRNSIILNGVVSANPYSAKKQLDKAGVLHIDFFSLIRFGGLNLTIPFWEGFYESYENRKSEYDWLYDKLADDQSRVVLNKLLDFRLNYNLDAMDGFVKNMKEQYYEPFLDLKKSGESFCDIGGFDGNTTIEFIKRCPNYSKIYFFEPEPDILNQAKNALSCFDKIDYYPYAISDKREVLHFTSSDDSSMVSETGEIEVQAEKIDNVVNSPVTFLKMDIEGSEALAIEGAKQTILKYHPRLAICVYHKGADFIDIPKQVLEIRSDYDLYMRHYTEGIIETVMFFMPKK